MITRIEIDGFKSFSNFQMEFAPLTVVAGANGSGKSNLFDAMELLGRLVDMDLKTAFSEQRGDPNELFTRFEDGSTSEEMCFSVELLVNKTIRDNFGGQESLKYTRLRYEIRLRQSMNVRGMPELNVVSESLHPIQSDGDKWVDIYIPKAALEQWRPKIKSGKRGAAYIDTENGRCINLRQDGKGGVKKEFPLNNISQAIISVVNSVDFPHVLAAKEEIKGWRFLQMNTDDLRQPSPYLAKDALTHSGKNLAAVLHRISVDAPESLKDITYRLNALLPNIVSVNVVDDKVGKQFVIQLQTSDNREFSSRVISEGTLRLLALCVFLYDPLYQGLLCFEDPENGVHPGRMKLTAELLGDLVTHFGDEDEQLQRQVIINTHSPVLVGAISALDQRHVYRIWLSQMVTQIKNAGGRKQKLQTTKMLPVIKGDAPMAIQFSEEERKLTLAQLANYLNTVGSDIKPAAHA
jgi:predicted ATPase